MERMNVKKSFLLHCLQWAMLTSLSQQKMSWMSSAYACVFHLCSHTNVDIFLGKAREGTGNTIQDESKERNKRTGRELIECLPLLVPHFLPRSSDGIDIGHPNL